MRLAIACVLALIATLGHAQCETTATAVIIPPLKYKRQDCNPSTTLTIILGDSSGISTSSSTTTTTTTSTSTTTTTTTSLTTTTSSTTTSLSTTTTSSTTTSPSTTTTITTTTTSPSAISTTSPSTTTSRSTTSPGTSTTSPSGISTSPSTTTSISISIISPSTTTTTRLTTTPSTSAPASIAIVSSSTPVTTNIIVTRPVTIPSPATTVSPVIVPSPATTVIPITIASPATIVTIETPASPATVVTLVTIASPATIVTLEAITSPATTVIPETIIVTTTFVSQVTITIAAATPTSTTGITTCTSRIINPTYTPTTSLPSNYLWGCPPGSLCRPPQEGCNWEQNPPADTYICRPEECVVVPEAPVPQDWNATWPNPVETNCAWYEPDLDYYHLDPEFFGLSFAIFDFNGQPVCPVSSNCGPTATATVTFVRRRRRTDNPLARIHWRRQSLAIAPAACYAVFDNTQELAQSIGKVADLLCPADSEFMEGVTACRACAKANGGSSSSTEDFPTLQDFLNFCTPP